MLPLYASLPVVMNTVVAANYTIDRLPLSARRGKENHLSRFDGWTLGDAFA
jgi:hypothetical protein